jgi:hypothetical protein
MRTRRYRRLPKAQHGGQLGSYTFYRVACPPDVDADDFLDYFFEHEGELVCSTLQTTCPDWVPSISSIFEDAEIRDADVRITTLRDKPMYICYVSKQEGADICLFAPMGQHTRTTVLQARYTYLDFLRVCRLNEEMDVVRFVKQLVRDPAYHVPTGVYSIAQKARRVHVETVQEEFNKPHRHVRPITYMAYDVAPEDEDLLDQPLSASNFTEDGFRMDADDIFHLCKKDIDFRYITQSIPAPSKTSRVLILFGLDEREALKGIRVVHISQNKVTRNISVWGRFACADGLGMMIQNKTIQILRNEMAPLASAIQGEKMGDNAGPVLRSWLQAEKHIEDFKSMRFKGIKSAVSFWQYMGYSIYRMNRQGDAYFEAKVLPQDSASVVYGQKNLRSTSSSKGSVHQENKKQRRTQKYISS